MQRWYQDAKMLCRGLDLTHCVHDGQRSIQLHMADREHRECFEQAGGFMTDDRPWCVSLLNPPNPLRPGRRGSSLRQEGPTIWQPENAGVRHQVGLALQAIRVQEQTAQAPRVQEQGRLTPDFAVQEQIAPASRVKEHGEQTLWLSRKREP